MLSVVSRCLGKMNRWQEVFDNIAEDGYNAIHFTPIQQYGGSGSHYSISNFDQIDDYYFEKPESLNKAQKLQQLSDSFGALRKKGVLSITDLVLNQISIDSEWLIANPNATYNLENSPHLYSAWLLDESLSTFSTKFQNCEIPSLPFAPHIKSESDLQ